VGKVTDVLKYLRVVDTHDNTVSLTSLLLGGAGAAVVATPSWPGVAALLVAAVLYGHKRVANRAEAQRDDTLRKLSEDVASASQKLSEQARAIEALAPRVTQLDNRTQHLTRPNR
jgi:hypothetical protein